MTNRENMQQAMVASTARRLFQEIRTYDVDIWFFENNDGGNARENDRALRRAQNAKFRKIQNLLILAKHGWTEVTA